MKRNILLLVLLVVLSVTLAMPVGSIIITKLFNSGGFATFSLPSDLGNFLNGFPFIYLFISSLLFGLFGKGKKWIWSIASTIPVLYFLYYIESGAQIWLWSLAFFVSGIIVGYLVNFTISKFKQPSSQIPR